MATHNSQSILLQTVKTSFPFLCVLFLFAMFWYGLGALHNPQYLPINKVTIAADSNLIPKDVLSNIVANNVRGGFFSLDTARLQNALAQLPWVKTAAIRRVWPNEIQVVIHERQAVALWNKNGVIDQTGDVFYPDSTAQLAALPHLFGPDEQLDAVIKMYQSLVKIAQPISMQLTDLILNSRGSWQLHLSSGAEIILGQEDMLNRFSRFAELYSKIIGDNVTKVTTIDLRYPNGLAVQWQPKVKNKK